jgi:hypothetical protein
MEQHTNLDGGGLKIKAEEGVGRRLGTQLASVYKNMHKLGVFMLQRTNMKVSSIITNPVSAFAG